MILLYVSAIIFSLMLFMSLIVFLKFLESSSTKIESKTKRFIYKDIVTKISKKEVKIYHTKFFCPMMGAARWWIDVENIEKENNDKKQNNEIKEIFVCLFRRYENSGATWHIANGVSEAIGTVYRFQSKYYLLFVEIFTFTLSLMGFAWPALLGVCLYYGTFAFYDNKISQELFIFNLAFLGSLTSGFLSRLFRNIYCYKMFLKIKEIISLDEETLEAIRKILFFKVIFSLGYVFLLPLDFLREVASSYLMEIIFSPFTLADFLLKLYEVVFVILLAPIYYPIHYFKELFKKWWNESETQDNKESSKDKQD